MESNKKIQMTVGSIGKGMTYAVQRDMVKTYLMSKNIIVTDPKITVVRHFVEAWNPKVPKIIGLLIGDQIADPNAGTQIYIRKKFGLYSDNGFDPTSGQTFKFLGGIRP